MLLGQESTAKVIVKHTAILSKESALITVTIYRQNFAFQKHSLETPRLKDNAWLYVEIILKKISIKLVVELKVFTVVSQMIKV